MIDFVRDRTLIIRSVLSTINPDYTSEDVLAAQRTWWRNLRSSGGLGLSEAGRAIFIGAGLKHWDFTVSYNLDMLLQLSRHCPCPYYLPRQHRIHADEMITLSLWDSRVASSLVLYDNDLQSLLNSFTD